MIDAPATGVIGPDELERIESWIGENLTALDDDPQVALAPGTTFRSALEDARAEIAQGLKSPSPRFRREYALVLGLQRMLSGDRVTLASGLELREHQVDALAGMLAALIGDAERRSKDDPEGEEPAADEDDEAAEANGASADHRELVIDLEALGLTEDDIEDEEEPERPAASADGADEDDEGELEPANDPGESRRYRFRHPTASGKTIAAAGFVEAARITGVLILTHRRLLVDQFQRDLTAQGYGERLAPVVTEGHGPLALPPVTVETYAWFIRNYGTVARDVYGVVLCDEAHTALGDKTAAAIRAFDSPTYIGMTATDELLQKHVSDVFPAEIADFSLADAVRRGVVAPLRAIRVKPGASIKRVKIVGGDYDQTELAQALDHEALNMAAAMLYLDRFGQRPGIVYAAGVDHAGRVAAAMRALGLKAAAVSGRTRPRDLAATLAAYDRGEINVLVNAQILAEGWNAPRATICMQLAPTASKRVYQQRVGRIMRLHRRKEAGVVVDFAEATAPHTDRTVTIHSLLGVDVYHPGALVTPRSPRRRQRWRRGAKALVREAGWLVPVTNDPARRREIILSDWKLVAIDRLPESEQQMWAENAGRKVGQRDLGKLAKVLANVSDETRMLFFATCAAENKNRALRLVALGDLAQSRPSANLFERAVRLVEAAPTWRLDRAQGGRTLLLALGDRRVDASDHQIVAWAWRLARASRDAQIRHHAHELEGGRELSKALLGARGDAAVTAAKVLVKRALAAPLDVGAALLAVTHPADPSAERIVEYGRVELSRDAAALAAALGSNIPLPRSSRVVGPGGGKGKARERAEARPADPAEAVAPDGVEEAEEAAEIGAAPHEIRRKRRRRRRRRRGDSAAPSVEADAPPSATVDGAHEPEAPSEAERVPESGPALPETMDADGDDATRETADLPLGAPTALDGHAAPAVAEPADSPPRKRTRRVAKAEIPEDGADAAAVPPIAKAPAPKRARRVAKAEIPVDRADVPAPPVAEAPAPKRARRVAKAEVPVDGARTPAAQAPASTQAEPDGAAEPKRPRRTRKAASPPDTDDATEAPTAVAGDEPAAPGRAPGRTRAPSAAADGSAIQEAEADGAAAPKARRRSPSAAVAPVMSPTSADVSPAAGDGAPRPRTARRPRETAPAEPGLDPGAGAEQR